MSISILQALCARLAIATGRDLAQACRDAFPKFISIPLWFFAELAICATDLAEVIGTAIGLNLLFGIPLEFGVIITALDVFLILWWWNFKRDVGPTFEEFDINKTKQMSKINIICYL